MWSLWIFLATTTAPNYTPQYTLASASTYMFEASVSSSSRPAHFFGFFPAYGTIHYSSSGCLKSIQGINWAFGYSWRNYMGEGAKAESWNPYFGLGTVAVIIPYPELGLTYFFSGYSGYITLSIPFALGFGVCF